jgi:GxxExxY protein
LTENDIAKVIVEACLEVHTILGPGLLESAYQIALEKELYLRGLSVSKQVAMPLSYKGEDLGVAYRLDLLVENSVVIEIKCVESLASVHRAQLLTYLRLMNKKLGLLVNFNGDQLRGEIKRVVNGL